MSNFSFSEDAWEEYLFWQAQDKKTLRKLINCFAISKGTGMKGSESPNR